MCVKIGVYESHVKLVSNYSHLHDSRSAAALVCLAVCIVEEKWLHALLSRSTWSASGSVLRSAKQTVIPRSATIVCEKYTRVSGHVPVTQIDSMSNSLALNGPVKTRVRL